VRLQRGRMLINVGKGDGGRGGHSIGIAFSGNEPLNDGVMFDISMAAAGSGGSGADEAGKGDDGIKTDMRKF
jgi:hypothetical protein